MGANPTLAKWDKPLWLLLFAAVCAVALWLRIANPPVTARSPDEKYYMYYAEKVLAAPLTAPRDFVIAYNKSSKNWTYPIPLRVAYYYSIAAIMALFRVDAEHAGVALSTSASILQFILVGAFGLRFFGRWPTLIALTLLAVSPPDLAMARRVWGDGVSGSIAMLLVWLCAEIFTHPRARLWYTAFWLSSIYFLLVKESGGIFYGLCVIALALHSWRQHQAWSPVIRILAAAIVTAAFAFTIMAFLCGGISPALETVHHSAQAAPTNIYGALYQNGPWYSFPLGLWMLSPQTAFGAAIALFYMLLPGNALATILSLNRSQRTIAAALGILIILIIVAATVPPALKNLRYISFIYGPFYLLAALGLTAIVTVACNSLASPPPVRYLPAIPIPLFLATVALGLILVAQSDYSRFCQLFVNSDIKDLNIRQIVTYPFENASP